MLHWTQRWAAPLNRMSIFPVSLWVHALLDNRTQRDAESITVTSADRGPGDPIRPASHPEDDLKLRICLCCVMTMMTNNLKAWKYWSLGEKWLCVNKDAICLPKWVCETTLCNKPAWKIEGRLWLEIWDSACAAAQWGAPFRFKESVHYLIPQFTPTLSWRTRSWAGQRHFAQKP